MAYCPRSSLPANVLVWLAGRLAHLVPPRPPGQGGTRPLCLEVRLDAVAAVILDGLSYRRAGRVVGISKTEVGDSLDLLLGPLRRWLAGKLPRARAHRAIGAGRGAGRHRGGQPAGPRVPGAGHGARALACAGRGPPHRGSAQRRPTDVQPTAGGATRAGGAGDRPPCRRVVAARLARAAVPGPGCLPRRQRAGLPGPVAARVPI